MSIDILQVLDEITYSLYAGEGKDGISIDVL
jgi:hypothetical protein